MSKTDWILLLVFLIGIVLFLYASNTYDVAVGYSGLYLSIGAIGAYLVIYIYKELTKKSSML
jgi:hypothetical protein